MKTIEERAWEKYPEVIKHHNLAQIDINEEKRKMYIDVATEQKALDIEKACKWLMEHIGGNVECNEDGEPFVESFIEERKFVMQIVDDFRKAMEE